MNKPVKWTLGIVAVLVVAAAAVVFYGATQLDRFVVDQIEAYGRSAAGTPVEVERVDISLTEGAGTVHGLTIGNPEGFDTDYALQIDDTVLDLELRSIGSNMLVLSEIRVSGARLNAEQRGQRTNLTEIMSNLQADDAEPAEPAADEARIAIDRFILTGATVTVTAERLDEPETLELDEVTVTDIGRPNGATYSEATDAILSAIFAAGQSAVRDRLGDAARDAVEREVSEELRDRLDDSLE